MSNTNRKFKGKDITDKDVKNQYPDRSCRNNNSCPHCKNNRTYSSRHREAPMLYQDISDKIDTYSDR